MGMCGISKQVQVALEYANWQECQVSPQPLEVECQVAASTLECCGQVAAMDPQPWSPTQGSVIKHQPPLQPPNTPIRPDILGGFICFAEVEGLVRLVVAVVAGSTFGLELSSRGDY